MMNPSGSATGNSADAPAAVSQARKVAAWLIRAAGSLIGAVAVTVFILLIWISPPDLSQARRPISFWLGMPVLLAVGPFWLADWIAGFVDKRRPTA